MENNDAKRTWRGEQERCADLCAAVLAEAWRRIVRELFDSALAQLLAHASEVLDRMDEGLIRLDPQHDSQAFARAAALHRELEAIQSRVPRAHRRLRSEHRGRRDEGRPLLKLVR